MQVLVRAMKGMRGSSAVQRHSCWALTNLAALPDNRRRCVCVRVCVCVYNERLKKKSPNIALSRLQKRLHNMPVSGFLFLVSCCAMRELRSASALAKTLVDAMLYPRA